MFFIFLVIVLFDIELGYVIKYDFVLEWFSNIEDLKKGDLKNWLKFCLLFIIFLLKESVIKILLFLLGIIGIFSF